MTTLGGLILAAGASSRMGRDKALLPWPPANSSGATLLSSAIAALQPFTAHIVVVAGENADKLAPIVASCGASMAHNPAPERGQFSSLQIGLRQLLAHGCNAAMVTPVDCPPLSASSLQLLCQAFEQGLASGHWAIAPEHNSRRGHPLLAARPLIDAFLAAPVTGNAREVKRAHAQHISSIHVPDPSLIADLNTPEQYIAVAAIPNERTR